MYDVVLQIVEFSWPFCCFFQCMKGLPQVMSGFLCVSGRYGTPCIADSHKMMATPMQAAYTNFPQQTKDHFQPQSPVCAPQLIHPTIMMDDFMVRNSSYSLEFIISVYLYILILQFIFAFVLSIMFFA